MVVRDKDVIADKESMEEDLQRYISLNTYLECDDPWFWQKLRWVKCSFLALNRSDAGEKSIIKRLMFGRKHSPNVDNMLVESRGVLGFKLSALSRSENPGESKTSQPKQSTVCT